MDSIELEDVGVLDPLRQGDVFALWNPDTRDPHDRVGVIVTADCDIRHGKTKGQITYLPIVPMRAYLFGEFAAQHLKSRLESSLKSANEEIARVFSLAKSPQKSISPEALLDWCRETDVDEILASIFEGEVPKKAPLSKYLQTIKAIQSHLETNGDYSDEALMATFLKENKHIGIIKEFFSQANGNLGNSSFEYFPIGPIAGVINGPAIVLTRHLRVIDHRRLKTRVSETSATLDTALRIARLKPPFRFALIQHFTALYSRVGLPDDHLSEHRKNLKNLCEALKAEYDDDTH